MPTAKHRIAAYLPPEVDEKFQAFKRERGVGDSQALILILIEFLGVSQEVSHGNLLNIDALKGELRGELLSELELRFSELRSELLSKPLESVLITQEGLKTVDLKHDSLVNLKVNHLGLINSPVSSEQRLTIAQLSTRFDCDSALVRKQKSKYKDEPEKFVAWSKGRDPDGYGWKFDETSKLFIPVLG
jgi:hypothetical protein